MEAALDVETVGAATIAVARVAVVADLGCGDRAVPTEVVTRIGRRRREGVDPAVLHRGHVRIVDGGAVDAGPA